MDVVYRAAGATDKGLKRKQNEDSILCMPEYGVFCVADGMGGCEDGEYASSTVSDHIKKAVSATSAFAALPVAEKAMVIESAINSASAVIKNNSALKDGKRESGSTVAVLLLDGTAPGLAMTLHAGDSRIYLCRGGVLRQIGKDHSFAEAIKADSEKDVLPEFRGLITRAVGLKLDVELEKHRFAVKPADALLLCSDGLNKMVQDGDIALALMKSDMISPAEICSGLIQKANEAGGNDNISVITLAFDKNCSWEALSVGEDYVDEPSSSVTTETAITVDYVTPPKKRWINYTIVFLSVVLVLLLLGRIGACVKSGGESVPSGNDPSVSSYAQEESVQINNAVEVALRTGNWKSFSNVADETGMWSRLDKNPILRDKCIAWVGIWSNAYSLEIDKPGAIAEQYSVRLNELSSLGACAGMQLLGATNVSFAGSADAMADVYCRMMNEAQMRLIAAFKDYQLEQASFVSAFETIAVFSAGQGWTNDMAAFHSYEEMKDDAKSLNQWVIIFSKEPLSAYDVSLVPVKDVINLRKSRAELENFLEYLLQRVPERCIELGTEIKQAKLQLAKVSSLSVSIINKGGASKMTTSDIAGLTVEIKAAMEIIRAGPESGK